MNWLFKEEPANYSFDALVKDKKTVWSGVKNPLAQKHLRSVKKGDAIFYYHTGDEKSVVGIARAMGDAYPDPNDKTGKASVVDVAPVKKLARPVTLAEIKADAAFKDFRARADLAALGHAGQRRRVARIEKGGRRKRRSWALPLASRTLLLRLLEPGGDRHIRRGHVGRDLQHFVRAGEERGARLRSLRAFFFIARRAKPPSSRRPPPDGLPSRRQFWFCFGLLRDLIG